MSEMPSCFTQVNRKARKDHKCCECFETIQKGETYSYTSGVWDGTGQSFKQCTNCHEIMEAAANMTEFDDPPCFCDLSGWFYNKICRGFSGIDFLNQMAAEIGKSPDDLNRLLKLDLAGADNG